MPHINRLSDFQFLEKFVLFERIEFTNFSLRKLKQSEEERFNWGVFFATFLHKQESRLFLTTNRNKMQFMLRVIKRAKHFLKLLTIFCFHGIFNDFQCA